MQRVRITITDPELIRQSLRQVEKGTVATDVSAERLINGGSEALNAAIDHMRRISSRLKRMERISSLVLVNGAITLFILNVFSLIYASYGNRVGIPSSSMVAVWFLYLVGLVVLPLNLMNLNRKRNRILDVISRFDDIRVLGPVTELLERDRPAASKALIRLLPRIKSEDREHLLPAHVSQLNQLLVTLAPKKGEMELGVTVIAALGKIGDSRSLSILERFAESRSRRYTQLREAAVLALPELRQYIDNLRLGKALLRPSEPPTRELLHPAAGADTLGNEGLLRPDTKQP